MSDYPITPHFNGLSQPSFVSSPSLQKSSTQKVQILQSDPKTPQSYKFQLNKSGSDANLHRSSIGSQGRSSVTNYDLDLSLAQNFRHMNTPNLPRPSQEKSQREKDLESKLGMVLAQNEKLNQLIEQISPVKSDNKGSASKENIDWREKYNTLLHSTQEQKKYSSAEQDRLISDLMSKEREIQALNDRHRDINSKNLSLSEENERLKATIREYETNSKNRFVEVNLDLIHQNETERKLLIALNTDLQIKVMTLNEEINGNGKVIAEQEAQVQFFKNELQKYLEIEARMINEINEIKRNSQPQEALEAKLQETQQNNEKLAQLNKELQDQLERLMMDVINIQALQAQIDDGSKHQAEDKKDRDSNSSYSECNPAGAIIEELNCKISSLLNDNQKSNDALYEKTRENETLLAQVTDLKLQLASKPVVSPSHPLQYPVTNEDLAEFEEYKFKIVELSAENERLKYTLNEQAEQFDQLKLRFMAQVNEHAEHVDQLNQRIKTIAEELHIKDGENELWRKKSEENSSGSIEVTQLKGQVAILSKENESLRRSNIENEGNKVAVDQLNLKTINLSDAVAAKESELNLVKKQLEEAKIQLGVAKEENERISNLLNEKIRQVTELEGKLNAFDDLSQKLNATARDLEAKKIEVDALKKKLEDKDSKSEFDTLKKQMIFLSEENERLNDLATEKTQECDRAHQKIIDLETTLGSSKDIADELARARDDNSKIKEEYNEVLGQVEILRNKILESRANEDLILKKIGQRVKKE